MKFLPYLIGLLFLALCTSLRAEERILDFHADIVIEASGALQVTETLRVRAEGRDIRRGIYRDFPTHYRDAYGLNHGVGFTVTGVERDGAPSPYRTQAQDNGVRVYIGDENVFLAPGEYTYTLQYRTDRQLGFFAGHDELYWNVTGNGWRFPIDRASAEIRLPTVVPVDQLRLDAYTGPQGAQGRAWRAEPFAGGAFFAATAPLGVHEGLTVVLGFPKGIVHEPSAEEQRAALLRDNIYLLPAGGGLLVLLLFYTVIWWRIGRDPRGGVIIPRYEPPQGYSAAALRFVEHMGYDNDGFTAGILELASGGRLGVERQDGQLGRPAYTLHQRNDAPAGRLSGDIRELETKLFKNGPALTLDSEAHTVLRPARKAHEKALKHTHEKRYFVTNSGWLFPGIGISLLTLALTLIALPEGNTREMASFMSLWLSFWTLGVVVLAYAVASAWKRARGVGSGLGALGISLFSLPFFAGEVFALGILGKEAGPGLPVLLIALILTNALFYQWLKAPTLAGRRLLDEIEGFRRYLAMAESEELNLKHPPEKTPELFERYLPYALALGVAQPWADKFADRLAQAGWVAPAWYAGSVFHDGGAFASELSGGLSSAIASSSSPPSSSSGGGGGGSSGGGGGGGGGGGW